MYKVVSDEYIDSLFEGANFGEDSTTERRKQLIKKGLKNQLDGFWTGHTLYHILTDGGFLYDAKTSDKKRLTALGQAFIQTG